jgi:hypothetical protein
MTRSYFSPLLAVSCAAFGLPLFAGSPALADKGLDIAKKVDEAWMGYKGEDFETELELMNASGDRVTRKMSGKMTEASDGEKLLLTIVWPADQKGIALLTWGHRTKDDDQWLYLPSIKRVKRISARGRSGSFLGSEFAYEDLISPWEADKYTYKYIRDQAVGKFQTWVVERYPKDRDSGYSKEVVWFDKGYLSALRIDYYDRKGKLLKVASFKDYKKYAGKWRADRVEMENKQTGKKSTFSWKKRELGKSLPEDLFTPEAL